MAKETLRVTGMHCASCALLIEKNLKKIIGMDNTHCINQVKNALQPLKPKGILDGELTVNERAVIKYDPSRIGLDEIKKAINNAGYRVLEETSLDRERAVREEELMKLKNLFIIGLIFSIPIVILSFPEIFGIDFSLRNLTLLI